MAGVAALPDPPSLSLTTNGIGLTTRAQSLKDAGLTRINVSLDTLDAERFRTLTRRDRLEDVLAGIAAAQSAGLAPVKINTVLMRSINDDEVLGLVEWALDQGLALRFIEQMPLDAHKSWSRTEMVQAAEILERLETTYTLRPASSPRGSEPAETWDVVGADGTVRGPVGVIGSVTRPFCSACDRVRLTSDGQLRNCLFAQGETDLRAPLRAGATDDEVVALMQSCLAAKRPVTGSTTRRSCSRLARCQPSVADGVRCSHRWLTASDVSHLRLGTTQSNGRPAARGVPLRRRTRRTRRCSHAQVDSRSHGRARRSTASPPPARALPTTKPPGCVATSSPCRSGSSASCSRW